MGTDGDLVTALASWNPMRPWRTTCAPVGTLATDNARKDREDSVSKKNKKATDEPMSPMAEALGQSADEETAKGYFDSLSAEQQLVNSTAPALESSPRRLDDDYMHRNFQQYAPGSQAMVDAIAEAVAEKLEPIIEAAIERAIAAKEND